MLAAEFDEQHAVPHDAEPQDEAQPAGEVKRMRVLWDVAGETGVFMDHMQYHEVVEFFVKERAVDAFHGLPGDNRTHPYVQCTMYSDGRYLPPALAEGMDVVMAPNPLESITEEAARCRDEEPEQHVVVITNSPDIVMLAVDVPVYHIYDDVDQQLVAEVESFVTGSYHAHDISPPKVDYEALFDHTGLALPEGASKAPCAKHNTEMCSVGLCRLERMRAMDAANVICKYGLSCTRPLCKFEHPKGRRMDDKLPEELACAYGRGCTRAECTFQHPVGRSLDKNPEAIPCAFGVSCSRVKCKFKHEQGRTIDDVPAKGKKAKGRNTSLCCFGKGCTRRSCPFSHPEGRHIDDPSTLLTPCTFGKWCTRKECPFPHPQGRAMDDQLRRQKASEPCPNGGVCVTHNCPYMHPAGSSGPESEAVERIRQALAAKDKATRSPAETPLDGTKILEKIESASGSSAVDLLRAAKGIKGDVVKGGKKGKGDKGAKGDKGGKKGEKGGMKGDKGWLKGDKGWMKGDKGGVKGDKGWMKGDKGGVKGDKGWMKGDKGGKKGEKGGGKTREWVDRVEARIDVMQDMDLRGGDGTVPLTQGEMDVLMHLKRKQSAFLTNLGEKKRKHAESERDDWSSREPQPMRRRTDIA